MRLKYLTLAMAAAFLMGACADDVIEIPKKPETETTPDGGKEEPEEKPEEKPEEYGEPVSISVGIKGMEESRSGIIEKFEQGSEVSVAKGVEPHTFRFDGLKWHNTQDLKVDKETVLTAVHPVFSEVKSDGYIIIDVTKQEDVLYDQQTVTPDFPTAQFNMKHKFSLVRIKILKDEYIGTGVVSDFKIGNIATTSRLYLDNGHNLWVTESKGEIPFGEKYVLNDESPETVDAIVAGKAADIDKQVTLSFLLDGERKTYYFPDWHRWEEGMMYTYTLKIKGKYNAAINKDDVPVDVEYWSQYGKTDDIVIMDTDESDWERYFTYSPRHKETGYYLYQNEAFPLGFNYDYWGSGKFHGKIRGVITRNGKIVEKFPADIHYPEGTIHFFETAAYVLSDPGTYKLEVLFQKEGETKWMRGHEEGNPDEYQFEILPTPSDNEPALRQLYMEEKGDYSPSSVYSVSDNDPFNLVYVISNRGKHRLSGEIKAVWSRDFSLKGTNQYPSQKRQNKPNDNEWNDEIGRMRVEIPAGHKFWKNMITCKIPVTYPAPSYYNKAVLNLYWKADGETEWKMLRLDGDYLLNRDFDGDVFREANNCLKIGLKSWHPQH